MKVFTNKLFKDSLKKEVLRRNPPNKNFKDPQKIVTLSFFQPGAKDEFGSRTGFLRNSIFSILIVLIIFYPRPGLAMDISSLSPADNGNTNTLGTNLVMKFFGMSPSWENGNSGSIVLQIENIPGYWTNVETFDYDSARLSGHGTNGLTIDPTNNLTNNKCYRLIFNPCSVISTNEINFGSDLHCYYNNNYRPFIAFNGFRWNFTTGNGTCSNTEWYCGNPSDWENRTKITIRHDQVNGDLVDFPVYLNLSDFDSSFWNSVNSNGSDLVLTMGDGLTKLDHELEFISTSTNQGALWFRAPSLSNISNSIFYMYYNNPSGDEINSTDTWNSNYVVVTHLNETPTTDNTDSEFQDSTFSNNDVKSKGTMDSADRIAGQIGNGVDLDGTDDHLDFGDITSISKASKFTLSAWLKPTSISSVLPIFGKGSVSVISLMHTGSGWNGSSHSKTNDNEYNYYTGSRNTNWTYSVMVYDSTLSGNDRFKIYVNGNPLSLTYGTIHTISGGNGGNLFVGTQFSQNYNGDFANAKFDEVRVSKTAHSAAWIKTEFINQSNSSSFYTIGTQESTGGGAPTVTSFSPADGASSVAIDTDLIINFSKNVDIQSGNLVIKKSSDNSTVQTINITSATGNGTSSLTINPSDFSAGTSYYVQIDATAIDDLFGNSFVGISDTTTWNFTTGSVVGWMDNNWTKRIKFTVDDSKVNGSVTDFPIYLKLNDFSSKNIFNDTRSDGGDIRITQGDGLTVLASELVQFNAISNYGELHFKAPNLSNTSNMDFYMYYGNSSARSINASEPLGKHSVWSNGFVAVYHMQENPNGDASKSIYNSVKNDFYGTPYGSMTSSDRVEGQLGNGTDFDGTNDFYATADINAIDNASKMTYSVWFKRRNYNSKIVLSKGTDSVTNISGVRISNDGLVYLEWNNTTQSRGSFASNDTNWHHLVSVFNGAGSSSGSVTAMIGYLDGNQKILSMTGTAPNDLSINSARFLIGKWNGSNSYADGLIDEVRIANKIRSINWAKTEFNNQNSSSTFYSVATSTESNTSNNQPKISSLYPPNRAQQVPLKANLKITFNENVTANTGNIIIKRVSNGSTFETIGIGSASISGATVTINPSSDFASNTEYYVILDYDLVRGADATAKFSGISYSNGWKFKTTSSHSNETIFHDN